MAAGQRTHSNSSTAGQHMNMSCDNYSLSVRVRVYVPVTHLPPLYARLPASFDFLQSNAPPSAAREEGGHHIRCCCTLPETAAQEEVGCRTCRGRTQSDPVVEEAVTEVEGDR